LWGRAEALTVKVSPSLFDLANAGSTILIRVNVENVTDLGGLEFKVSFDSSVLVIPTTSQVVEGTFLSGALVWRKDISTPGQLKYGATLDSGVSGSGTLIEITFTVLDPNACERISLYDVKLVDSSIPPNELDVDSVKSGIARKCGAAVTVITSMLNE
jgi:hypothetical protein